MIGGKVSAFRFNSRNICYMNKFNEFFIFLNKIYFFWLARSFWLAHSLSQSNLPPPPESRRVPNFLVKVSQMTRVSKVENLWYIRLQVLYSDLHAGGYKGYGLASMVEMLTGIFLLVHADQKFQCGSGNRHFFCDTLNLQISQLNINLNY